MPGRGMGRKRAGRKMPERAFLPLMRISEFAHHRRLTPPDHFLDIWAFASVWFIVFALYLLGSRFVFAPGLTLELPLLPGPLTATPTLGVLTLANDRLFFFDGRILSPEDLEEALGNFLARHPTRPAILLLRPDRHLPVETLCRVSILARRSGFGQVQIACLEEEAKST